MQFTKVPGTASDEREQRCFVEFYQQWSAFAHPRHQSWIDFTFVKLQAEYSPYKGSFEFELWILGLGFTATYIYDRTFTDQMADTYDELVAGLKARASARHIHDPTGALDQLKGNERGGKRMDN